MTKKLPILIITLLFGLILTFNPKAVKADSPELIQSSQTVSRIHQQSRSSSVKVSGINGGHGSGTYIQIGNRYGVITARHVAEGDSLFIIENDGQAAVGRAVYLSNNHDIALIETGRLRNTTPVKLGDIEAFDYEIGETVVYSGFPSSYDKLTSTGIISGYQRDHNAVICQGFAWPGSSGSGVFTQGGNLVGVVYAVGVERYAVPEIIETLVYIAPLSDREIRNMRRALED